MYKVLISSKRIDLLTKGLMILVMMIFLVNSNLLSQDTVALHHFETQSINKKQSTIRKWVLGSVQTSLWTATLVSLDKAWYADYEKSSFRTFNDWNEWQHMDKLGHLYSAYHINEQTSTIWEWAGTDRKKAILIGGLSSFAFLSSIEMLDAYSAKWGFSSTDVLANFIGSGLYIGQALGWKDQRIRLKFSYHPKDYGMLNDRANQLFGKKDIERLLKDYNGQTYWASLNIKSFFPKSNLPDWLCLSIGYGADNMLGGFNNVWTSPTGTMINRSDLQRNRKFLLSADIDLSKFKTNSKGLKTIFSLLNTIKIPAPTIIFNTKEKTSLNLFYF
jgi:hypothetical protein